MRRIVLCLCTIFLLSACVKSEREKREAAKQAELRTKIAELEAELATYPTKLQKISGDVGAIAQLRNDEELLKGRIARLKAQLPAEPAAASGGHH